MSMDNNSGGCLSPLLTLLIAVFGGIAFLFTTGQPITGGTMIESTLAMPTYTIVLAPQQGTPSAAQGQQMTAVLDQRLAEFTRVGLVARVQQNTLDASTSAWTITLSTPPTTDINALLGHLIMPGVVELVDLSSLSSADATALLQQQIGTTYPTLLSDADFLAAAVTPDGAERLAAFNAQNGFVAVGLVLDGVVLSVPFLLGLEQPIPSMILSGFTDALQLQNLTSAINSDSLPFPLVIVSMS